MSSFVKTPVSYPYFFWVVCTFLIDCGSTLYVLDASSLLAVDTYTYAYITNTFSGMNRNLLMEKIEEHGAGPCDKGPVW